MSEAAVQSPVPQISWEDFQRKYLSREDRYKYEWVNGRVEKTLRGMNEAQFYILTNLIRFLYGLKSRNPQLGGELIAEGDTFYAGNHRRPDIGYYSDEQIQAARHGAHISADFVIEVISTNDQMEKVHLKMQDYQAAGVRVVWHIFPKLQTIHVYRGKNMTICTGDDLCSAEPVIEGFALPAKKAFE